MIVMVHRERILKGQEEKLGVMSTFIENHGDSLKGAYRTHCEPEICAVSDPYKVILRPMLSLEIQMMGCKFDPILLCN